jgi:hypothetical protein
MSFTRPVTSLIASPDGTALTAFLTASPEQWAADQMNMRYRQAPPSIEEMADSRSWAVRCYEHLKVEYKTLRGWFTPENKLSPLLIAPFQATLKSQPAKDGLGWDFKASLDGDVNMQHFKSTLIYAYRAATELPVSNRTNGNVQFSGLMRIVRAAYGARAESQAWKPILKHDPAAGRQVVTTSAEELSKRWVAFRTFCFMVQVGCDPYASWQACKCQQAFGPVDNDSADLSLD